MSNRWKYNTNKCKTELNVTNEKGMKTIFCVDAICACFVMKSMNSTYMFAVIHINECSQLAYMYVKPNSEYRKKEKKCNM